MKIFLLKPISTAPHCPNNGFSRILTSPCCDTWSSSRTCTCNCRARLPYLCVQQIFHFKTAIFGRNPHSNSRSAIAQVLVVWRWGKNEVKLSKTREQSFSMNSSYALNGTHEDRLGTNVTTLKVVWHWGKNEVKLKAWSEGMKTIRRAEGGASGEMKNTKVLKEDKNHLKDKSRLLMSKINIFLNTEMVKFMKTRQTARESFG